MLTFDPQPALATYQVVIDGQEVSFGVAAAAYGDFLGSFDWAIRQGVLEIKEEKVEAPGIGGLALDNYNLLLRIKSWEGIVDSAGAAVACTEANKLIFFAKYPAAMFDLAAQTRRAEAGERKNSGTSPAG